MSRFTANIRRTAAFLDRWYWLWLALAAPFLLFPAPARTLVLIIVPGLWVVAWLAGNEPLTRTPLNGTLLLLSLMTLVSVFATYDFLVSLPKIAGMVLGVGVFFAIVRAGRSVRGWWFSFAFFLASAATMTAVGLLGARWLLKIGFLTPIYARIPAIFTKLPGAEEGLSANQLAGMQLWVIPVLLILPICLVSLGRLSQPAYISRATIALVGLLVATSIFILGVFVFTQSRSAYIGLALGALVMAVFVLPTRWQLPMISCLVVIGIIAYFAFTRLETNVWASFEMTSASSDSALSLDSFGVRLEIWSSALSGIQDFPITGMGMNTFRHIVHVLYPLSSVDPDFDIAHAHSEFLQAALDLGIPGLIAFIALYFGAFWTLAVTWQGSNKTKTPCLVKALAVGFGAGLFAHIIYGLTDAVTLGSKPGVLFWMLLALIASLSEWTQTETLDPLMAWIAPTVTAEPKG